MNRILLVEDDSQIREIIADYFSAKGKDVLTLDCAKNGDEGLERLAENEYDLILLDVMLPGMDGFSLCRQFRKKEMTPVIFLTARGREEDIIYGYSLGCDDYIVKPFSLAVLYAKVLALINRSKGTILSPIMVLGDISLNPSSYEVYAAGKCVELAPKEYALLKYMMEHKNVVIERDDLLVKIWGYDYDGNDRVVDNHIKKLRTALGSCRNQIKTIRAKGYQITE